MNYFSPLLEALRSDVFLISPVWGRGGEGGGNANCDRKVIMRPVKLTSFPGSRGEGEGGLNRAVYALSCACTNSLRERGRGEN